MVESMCVVLACDRRYAIHVAASVSSAVNASGRTSGLEVHVLGFDLGKASTMRLERLADLAADVSITVHHLDLDEYSKWVRSEHISQSAYLRLRLADVVPNRHQRVIYLDADTICLQALDALATIDLEGHAIAAARDTSTPTVSSSRGIASYAELGLSGDEPYFNSGVLVIDLEKWRQAQPAVFAQSYVDRFGTVQQALDQEILNALFVSDWEELHPRWNASPRLFNYEGWTDEVARSAFESVVFEARSYPAVVHFLGPKKPWHFFSSAPWRSHYFEALQASGWFGSRSEYLLWRLGEGREFLRRRAKLFRRRLRSARSALLDSPRQSLLGSPRRR